MRGKNIHSRSDATMPFLDDKHSEGKSGDVKKSRPVRRCKKQNYDEYFKCSDDDSSSFEDSGSDDIDDSDYNDDVYVDDKDDDYDDQTDDDTNKKSSTRKTKVTSYKNEASKSSMIYLRKRRTGYKKKQLGRDNEVDEKSVDKTNDSNDENYNGKKDSMKESHKNHHSSEKRKSPLKMYDENVVTAYCGHSSQNKTVSARRKRNIPRIIVIDDDDNEEEEEKAKEEKETKSSLSARKRKRCRYVVKRKQDCSYDEGDEKLDTEDENEKENDDDYNDHFEDEPEPAKKNLKHSLSARKGKMGKSAAKRRQICSDDEGEKKAHTEEEKNKDNDAADDINDDDDVEDFQDELESSNKRIWKRIRTAVNRQQICSDDEGDEKPDTEDENNKDGGDDDDDDDNDDDDDDFQDESEPDKKKIKYSLSARKWKTSRSSDKRRQICSDDEGDEKPDTEDDSDRDYESKSLSHKKKFKRIKTIYTSSLETFQFVDPEDDNSSHSENDGNESETSICISIPESSDEEELDEDTLLDSADIEQLRDFQKDDSGTLQLLRHYILWFAMKAGGENLDEVQFQETVKSKNKLDAKLEVVMNICQSQAWGDDFRKDVMTYPEYNDDVKHSDLEGGDMRHLGDDCQVCNREGHPWSAIVKLEGEPYDRESYEMRDEEEGEYSLDLPAVEYYMGCFCHPRTKLFHKLCHFGHALYHQCKDMLEDYGDDEKKIDKVATDMSLLKQMYTKLKKLMKEAEHDYTMDGRRGNNKWKREYVG